MKRERHYCDWDTEHHDSADCGCQCFACTAAQSQKRHDDAIEAETVAAIVVEVTARRDRATKHRHAPYGDGCDECGRERALDDLLDWLSDWKRGG